MNLLRKFKCAIFLSSYFATLVLTKKNMCLQNCLPNCISHLAKSLSQALVRKYTSNSLADLMVFPIIYINFFLSFG